MRTNRLSKIGLWAVLGTFMALMVWCASACADEAKAWGYNSFGQLGNTSGTYSSRAVSVKLLGAGVTDVAAGGNHSLGVMDGAAWAWGWNADGQLGDGTLSTQRTTPVPVSGLGAGVTAVAAGYQHSLAIQDGGAWAWGYNGSGQLGDGTYDNHNTPVPVSGLSSGVSAIAGGGQYSLALKDGGVWAWGNNGDGQLGDGTRTTRPAPAPVSGLAAGVTAIASGGNHNLAINDGRVWAWGNNDYGQLGDGSVTMRPVPVEITSIGDGVTTVSAGQMHSLALKDGGVWAWGYNGNGELGDGTKTQRRSPVQVDPVHLTDIVAVAAGQRASFALDAHGSLWVWGSNTYGDLGLGDTTERLVPTQLLAPDGYAFTSVDADAYGYHAVATLAIVPEPAGCMLLLIAAAVTLIRRPQAPARL